MNQGNRQPANKAAIVFNGLTRDGGGWIASFTYEAGMHIWLTAQVKVPPHIPDDRVVSFARGALHSILTKAADLTAEWKEDEATLQAYKALSGRP